MRISHRYRFIFFANPKTGSESVRAFLNPFSDVSGRPFEQIDDAHPFYSHMRPIEAREIFERRGWRFDEYYRFVFVRNPWTRLVSLYNMTCRIDKSFGLSFKSWLRASKPEGKGGGGLFSERWRRYGTYSIESFAGDGHGNLLVDDIFRLEDIDSVPDRLRERSMPIPPEAKIPRLNCMDGVASIRNYYTPELVELVSQRYHKEIAKFGYEFPA